MIHKCAWRLPALGWTVGAAAMLLTAGSVQAQGPYAQEGQVPMAQSNPDLGQFFGDNGPVRVPNTAFTGQVSERTIQDIVDRRLKEIEE